MALSFSRFLKDEPRVMWADGEGFPQSPKGEPPISDGL